MNTRTQFEKDWIDGPALELSMVPIDQRGETVIGMIGDIKTWIAAEFPDLTPEQVQRATSSYMFSIIQRAVEVSKASNGAIGHA